MVVRNISIHEFTEYSKRHELCNYAQTVNYAMLMSEYGYEYELICLSNDGVIMASSLLLIKTINNIKYAYAPKGFLIDYKDKNLLKIFTHELKKYLYNRDISFLKINPEIVSAIIDNKTYERKLTSNYDIIRNLQDLGYNKLKDNVYFESLFPRFTGIIDLNTFSQDNLTKNTKNKINKGIRKGLYFSKGTLDDIKYINKFKNNDSYYFRDLYNIYSKTGDVDVFTISIDNEKYLRLSQELYIKEYDNNQMLNDKMIKRSHSTNINKKMESDRILLTYKNDIMEATKLVEENKNIIIAIGLVVKNNSKVTILTSIYDKSYKRYVPNYFLYYNIIKHYAHTHTMLDLNGLSGDFSSTSPYNGLNTFKLSYSPTILEFIGEFDLIIDERKYYNLLKKKLLTKEFETKYN